MAWFFIIFFTSFTLTNLYLFRRVWQGLASAPKPLRIGIIAIMLASSLSYVAARALLSGIDSGLYTVVLWMGSMWFAFMHYSILFVLLGELLRLLLIKRIAEMKKTAGAYEKAKLKFTLVSLFFVLTTLAYGYYNAQNIKVRELDLEVSAPGAVLDSMRIVYFSDSHLTPVNDGTKAEKLAEAINGLNADVILTAGDIVDDQIHRLLSRNIDKPLKNFRSTYGTYVVNGNHEYIVGVEESDTFLRDAGFHVLRDSLVTIASSITVAGRDDSAISRFTSGSRKDVAELLSADTVGLPIVVLDHQPFNLSKTAEAGATIQLSGHTHHGQIWPFNYVTSLIYEVSWGYKKIGNLHTYVTSGVGTWGPPVRTGSDSEIVLIRLTFIK